LKYEVRSGKLEVLKKVYGLWFGKNTDFKDLEFVKT